MFLGIIVQVLWCSYVFTVTYFLLLFFSHLSFCNSQGSTAENCSEEASRFGKRNVKPINKLIGSKYEVVMNNYPEERNASVIFIENTKLLWHWLENIRNIMCPSSL